MEPRYEIEHCTVEQAQGHSIIALLNMLTGLPVAELLERLPARLTKDSGWYSRDFSAAFRALGYNCSPRFIPFNPATPYPCLLRYGPSKELVARNKQEGLKHPDYWCVTVYYDQLVYSPHHEWPFWLEDFNPDMRITSMMPVWM